MSTLALVGSDLIQFGTRNFSNFASGVVAKVTFSEDVAKLTMGKDGNAIIAPVAGGRTSVAEVRVIAGTGDDAYLNRELKSYLNDPAGYTLFNATLTKIVGDGSGNKKYITLDGFGGFVKKLPDMQTSTGGEEDQAVAVWEVQLVSTNRTVA